MSNRKTNRQAQTAQRKKKPGFNPRHHARKETREHMAAFFAAVDKYEAEVKRIGERIEIEREQIHARAGDKKELALAALEKAYAVFLAVIAENKPKLEQLIVKADQEGVSILERTKDTDIRWEDLKFEVVAGHATLGEFHGEIVLMLQDYAVTMTSIFTMYENYSVKLRDSADAELPDFETEFKRLLQARAEEVSEEEDPQGSRESRAEAAFEQASS